MTVRVELTDRWVGVCGLAQARKPRAAAAV